MGILAFVTMLQLAGCTLPGASGIAANIEVESGGDPTANGYGLGIYQAVGERRRRMIATLGRNWADARYQLGYMLTEIREYGLYESTCLGREAGQVAEIVMLDFERPRARDPRYRMYLARQIHAAMAVR